MKLEKMLAGILTTTFLIGLFIFPQPGYSASHGYDSQTIAGHRVNYVTLDMNNNDLKPVILNANNQICATQNLSDMAKSVDAVAAINGTYFEAYNNNPPVPWGMIIKDKKILHCGGGAVVGITDTNGLIVDNITVTFTGYANDAIAVYPWWVNHPSEESQAIGIFTPEFGETVTVPIGGQAVLVDNGLVTGFATGSFTVPANGFAFVYNAEAVGGVARYKVGDRAHYTPTISTKHTKPSDWENVVCGLGAGPSLIINGVVTASGENEGFTEGKINTNKAGRSFIGADANGKIIMGNIGSATLKEAATVCQSLGLVNAICLDGGGSIGLYYRDQAIQSQGRAINNGLAFVSLATNSPVATGGATTRAMPMASKVYIDGQEQGFEAYTINNNTYFKLRDLAGALSTSNKPINVQYNQAQKAIEIILGQAYMQPEGPTTDRASSTNQTVDASKNSAAIYVDGQLVALESYTINQNTFFKLRDIAELADWTIGWEQAEKSITVSTK